MQNKLAEKNKHISQAADRGSASILSAKARLHFGMAALLAASILFGAVPAAAEPAIFTVESIEAVRTSDGTDGATTVLFMALGAAVAAAATVATGGIAGPATTKMLQKVASGGTKMAAEYGAKGDDDIYFTINGSTVWPSDAYSRTIGDGETEPVNLSFDFDSTQSITFELWERDTGSENDFLGRAEFLRQVLPYEETVIVANSDENSYYHVKVKIIAAASNVGANCVQFFTGIDGTGPSYVTICGKSDFASRNQYMNLGYPGTNSHHDKVRSFRCGVNVKYVQFIDGRKDPMARHDEKCAPNGAITNPVLGAWVNGNATGVILNF